MYDGYFKDKEDGSWIFYPWGVFGKGRLIASINERDRINVVLIGFDIFCIIGILICLMLFSMTQALLVFFSVVISSYGLLDVIVFRRLPLAQERLTFYESQISFASSLGITRLLLMLVVALVFCAVSIFYLYSGNDSIAIFGVLFFGWCLILVCYQILLLLRAK